MANLACPEEPTYSDIVGWRADCIRRFGDPRALPAAGPYEQCRSHYKGGAIMDVGAGDRRYLRDILRVDDTLYESLDSDPRVVANYRSFNDIPACRRFQLIALNQVLEHLTIRKAAEMMDGVARHLADEGRAIVSVPNMFHPVRYWGDVTHVTHWPPADLYGLVRHVGLDVEAMTRSNKVAISHNPLKRFVIRTVCEAFRVDWHDTITMVARRPS